MTKKWVSDKNQRRGKRYKKLHSQLAYEVHVYAAPEPSKYERKQMVSIMFRQQGES